MSRQWAEDFEELLRELVEAAEERGLQATGHPGMLDYDPRPIGEIIAEIRAAGRTGGKVECGAAGDILILRQQLAALEQRCETHLGRAREAEAALEQRERETLERALLWAAENRPGGAGLRDLLGALAYNPKNRWRGYIERGIRALAEEECCHEDQSE
jgi:hypothetical protein